MGKYDARITRIGKRIPRATDGLFKVRLARRDELYTTEDGRTLTHDEYCEEFDVVFLSPNLTDEQRRRNDRITAKILYGEDDW